MVGQAATEVMAAVNPNQSPVGPGPARQGPARSTESSEGDPIFVSCSNPATQPRTRQVVDLFQPVTSSEPPAVTVTDQPVTPIDGLNQDGELLAATPQSGYARGARRWTDRGAGLILGTPGAVIALVASAALVLVVAGMTMSTTSSSTESPVAGPTPGRLAAPITPAISDEHLVTVPPLDAPAGFARQTPTKAYSPDPPPAPARQQALPTAHHAMPASPAPPPAPDPQPLSPPPSPPPSTVTAEDAGYRTITPGSYRGNMESPTTDTEPCNCDGTMRKIPNDGDRPSKADRQRELRAHRAGYRSTSTAQEPGDSDEGQQDRQTARPGAEAGPRPSPNRGP
jgi:hypothetical protein